MLKTDPPIVVAQSFNVSKEKLWSAITIPEQMLQWFFKAIPAFEARVGFQTKFKIENEGRSFIHLWTITEVKPFQKIIYNWKYEGYPGDSFVIFELIEQEKGSCLKLTHRIVESFSQDIPEFQRESCLGGWNYFIKESLPQFLEKKEV